MIDIARVRLLKIQSHKLLSRRRSIKLAAVIFKRRRPNRDLASSAHLSPVIKCFCGRFLASSLIIFKILIFFSGLLPDAFTQQQNEAGFHIKANVDLVVLNMTVFDEERHFVPNLTRSNFRVFEDGIEQKLSMFSHEDIPVTMGLVIDNSGSMREKRAQVNSAAVSFVRMSNPEDEVFVVNFDQEIYLDSRGDFTGNLSGLSEVLSRKPARNGTALYDAVAASLDHIRKGHKDKKVLLVITDGDDDASRISFQKMIQIAKESNASIYAIGIFSKEDRKNDRTMVRRSRHKLIALAKATGGASYFPDSLADVEAICTQLAYDIRNQYALGYYPLKPVTDGKFRSVRVQLTTSKAMGKLIINTIPGYYPKKSGQDK
jgi:Ca-activated chloride channel homolog